MIVGEAQVVIVPLGAGFETALKNETKAGFAGLSKDAEKAGEESGSKLSKGLAKGLLGAATAVVGFGAAGIDAALKFEKMTASIAANAAISEGAAKKIAGGFQGMEKTVFNATELGKAYAGVAGQLGNLAGHALSAGEATKVMGAAQTLAEASGESLESSTKDLANVMLAYHVGVAQAASASDVLFTTSHLTGIGQDQLATQLVKVKGKLGDLAPSLGESAGLLDALAKNGVMGRGALAALAGSFTTLEGGGKPVTAMAKQLGVTIFDTSGKFVGMRSVIEQLQPKLLGLTEQSQIQATKALFGASANKQLLDVVLKGPAAYEADINAVTKANAAKEAAEKRAKTLGEMFQHVKVVVEELALKFGNILIPKLVTLGNALASSIGWLEKHKDAAKALAVVIATVLGTAVAVFATQKAIQFGQGVQSMIGSMGKLVTGIQGGVTKIIASFSAQNAAAEASAVAIGGSEAATVAEVQAADGSIEAANAAAGASFGAMATKAGLAFAKIGLAAAAAVLAIEVVEKAIKAVTGEESAVNQLLGGGQPGESGKEGEVFMKQRGQILSGTGSPKSRAKFLENLGIAPTAAAGLAGNFAQEGVPGDTGASGLGIGQWMGSRRTALEAFAKSQHEPITSERAQLEFAAKEIKGSYGGTYAAAAAAKTPQEAAAIIMRGYEKPLEGPTANQPHREAAAGEAYSGKVGYAGRGTLPTSGTGTLPTGEQEKAKEKEAKAQTKAVEKAAKEAEKAHTQAAKKMAAEHAQDIKEMAHKIAGDQKAGTAMLNKMLEAIHSHSAKALEKIVGGVHEKGFHELIKNLDHDHESALTKLAKELTKVHKDAMEALRKALEKQEQEHYEKRVSGELAQREKIGKEVAETTATRIADTTKVTLDKAAEAGLSGAELAAAHAQTVLDETKLANDTILGEAKLAADKGLGLTELQKAVLSNTLAEKEDAAKIAEAQAQANSELASNAAKEASKKTQEEEARARKKTEEEEAAKRKTEEPKTSLAPTTGTTPGLSIGNLTINGTNLSPAELLTEIGFSLKTGLLPVAQPVPA